MNRMFLGLLKWLLNRVPLEQIIAYGLNLLFERLFNANERNKEVYDNVLKTVNHITESLALAHSILEDCQVDEKEVVVFQDHVNDLRLALLNIWSKGESGKEIEAKLLKE